MPAPASRRTTTLIAAATVGVYALVMAGATTAITDAAAACSGWPTCDGRLLPAGEPDALIAWGHRVVALLVGGLVLAAAWFGIRETTDRRIQAALAAATALYPLQVGIGAITATRESSAALSGLHLLAGVAIFGGFLLALAWLLETDAEGESTPDPEPIEAPDPEDGDPYVPPPTALGRAKETLRAYVTLTKPRLMWLLCLVAAAAMALAGGPGLTVRTVALTLGGGVLAIGASGTFNHVLERDRDRRMRRTSDRPVATHRIPIERAVAFGVGLAALSLTVFLQVNALTALLGLVAIVFYSVIYTLVLKPNTVQNTVIGGAAGALPALIGWAAVTGRVGLPGLVLAALIFVWTPAHFYNLALAYKEDYARGGFPMMPVVRGETTTRKHILLWLGATLSAASVLIWLTDLGWLAAATTTVLGAVFLWAVVALHREQTEQAAFRAFHASNAYLGLVLVAIVVDALAV